MRLAIGKTLVLAATAGLLFAGSTNAVAAPKSDDRAKTNHGQCVSNSPKPDGKGGRSAVASNKAGCQEQATRLVCVENEDGGDTVQRDSAADTVTITGSGPDSLGSALQCEASIEVAAGDTISADYVFGQGTAPCGGGVPRMYVVIDGEYYNTFDDNANECEATTTSLVLPVGGTVTEIGFVYDRGDNGSVTYSNARVGDVTLNI